MSNILHGDESPERRVFGGAFSFARGEADQKVVAEYFQERTASVAEGNITWMARTLDADSGVVADLYVGKRVVALLELEYGYNADVYDMRDEGVLMEQRIPFEKAVDVAEKFAAKLSQD